MPNVFNLRGNDRKRSPMAAAVEQLEEESQNSDGPVPIVSERILPGGVKFRFYRFTTVEGIKYAGQAVLHPGMQEEECKRRHFSQIELIRQMWRQDVRGGQTVANWRTGIHGENRHAH